MQYLLHSAAPTLARSIRFYQKLGFSRLSYENGILYTDGNIIVELNPDPFARPGVKVFSPDIPHSLPPELASHPHISVNEGFILRAPSGIWVYLMRETPPVVSHKDNSPSILRNYAGLSLETIDLKGSQAFWEALGLAYNMGDEAQGWISLQSVDGFVVSLMKPLSCPHIFVNPSFTYFNGQENLQVITQIRELQVPIEQEVTAFNTNGIVDNVILRDPGGFGFFVFND